MTVIPHFDPACVPDIFVSQLSSVEEIGSGILRFTFTSVMDGDPIVVARIIMPARAVATAINMASETMSGRKQKVEVGDMH